MKHSQESRDAIVEALRSGATIAQAGRVARVPSRTIALWMQKGRAALDDWDEAVEEIAAGDEVPEGELPELNEYGTFWLDAAEALGQRNLKWMQDLEATPESNWTRLAWLLERTTPDEFSLRENVVRRLELTGAEGGPVRATRGTPDLAAVLRALVAASAAAGDDERLDGDGLAT